MSYGPPPPGGGYGPYGGGYGGYGGYGPTGGHGLPGAHGGPAGEPPKTHLALNIMGILSCLPVLGIVGLVFALQVNSKWALGDYVGAQSASHTARVLGIIGVVLFVPVVLYALLMIVGLVAVAVSEI